MTGERPHVYDKASFDAGYVAGQRSMEAKHRTVTERLVKLDLAGGSHENLSAIASCFYQPTFGWTWGACEILRDKLIEILEGKDGNDDNDSPNDCNCGHHRCDQHQVSYDELGNERHKAVCELRGVSIDALCEKYDYVDIYPEFIWAVGQAIALRHGASFEEIINRLIHLLGGDEPDLQMTPKAEESGVESAHKMTKSAENAKPESEDGSENCRTTDEKLNGESLIESLVKSTEELSRQGKVKFPPNEDGSLDSLKTVEEAEALIEDVKRRADQSHDSSPMRQENETRITDELREYADAISEHAGCGVTMPNSLSAHSGAPLGPTNETEDLYAIADRIDEQFDRICEQQEKVLQDTIDYMTIATDLIEPRVEELTKRCEELQAERDELREKCDRLKAKVEHQREQLAVYATMYDFDAIRALKRERNEHKHRADNAEGHVKSSERRLDAAHETYCALLNDAAREFRALTEERDELQAKLDDYDKTHVELPKDATGYYWHIGDESEYGEVTGILYNNARTLIEVRMGNGERNMFGASLGRKAKPVTVEQVIRDLTLGKITGSQAVERIEGING